MGTPPPSFANQRKEGAGSQPCASREDEQVNMSGGGGRGATEPIAAHKPRHMQYH